MLDFYISEGIEDVCFNVEESEGKHASELFAEAAPEARFKRFLSLFWALARQSGRIRFIREIDGMLPRVFRSAEGEFRNVQVEPLAMLNVDCEGRVSTFSPELLGLKHAGYADFIIGNINTDSSMTCCAVPQCLRCNATRSRRRVVPENLRVFLRLRRRCASQQAERKWQLGICDHSFCRRHAHGSG